MQQACNTILQHCPKAIIYKHKNINIYGTRFDRLGQVALIGSGITAVSMGVQLLVKSVAKATGKNSGTIAAGMAGFVAFATLFKKLNFFMKGGISPADVLTKTNTLK